jgi:hypothetical protein
MAEEIRYRYWCTTCNDFSLHKELDNDLQCDCGKIHQPSLLRDIPKDKLLEQQERFRKQRTAKAIDRVNAIASIYAPMNIFSMLTAPSLKRCDLKEIVIVESDAGLKAEEERIKERRLEIIQERKTELNNFSSVGRNDICLCGSDKKYKKCCYSKHQSW